MLRISDPRWPAWMAKGGEIGFGGGSLEHPRQGLGAQWAGLSSRSAEPARAARRVES